MEIDLAVEQDARMTAKREMALHLERMESISIDATLHAFAKLMEEFKDRKHA